jgi:hypothetical protein
VLATFVLLLQNTKHKELKGKIYLTLQFQRFKSTGIWLHVSGTLVTQYIMMEGAHGSNNSLFWHLGSSTREYKKGPEQDITHKDTCLSNLLPT